ncbi:murein hydrolase activator EnvC family protein [Microbacterium oxydans]|uniref:Murein hydrolase activator NlpD n=1 Tax=Microbacterium oxydans TaxID=82380 RepID=A0A0F0L4F9_9MICO|nr:M23 family metallopeptidase [Microbacterium oxydans]KJL28057.1 Murein hydrolase activator NlpD precursor [Microbacterium oxydans]
MKNHLRALGILGGLLLTGLAPLPAADAAPAPTHVLSATDAPASAAAPADTETDTETEQWTWPGPGARVILEPFRAPAHAYGAGHRGIDIEAPIGSPVVAPAPGTVMFRGVVVDRALLTIEHDGGLVTTFEPVDSPLRPGDSVAAGDAIGIVTTGGHSEPGAMHLGVRLEGVYINPLLLFGDVPRAVLLPCCT